jgi:hypothetical protein
MLILLPRPGGTTAASPNSGIKSEHVAKAQANYAFRRQKLKFASQCEQVSGE